MILDILCLPNKWTTQKKINTDNIFNAVQDRNSLHQAQITELTETTFNVSTMRTNDQKQSSRPPVNGIVD